MDVGSGSSFTTAHQYTQTGGTTQVDGTLTATGGQVNINGGTLSGTGTVDPPSAGVFINIGGTLSPGDPGSTGTINIGGNLSIAGTLDELIGGTPGSGKFDVTDISGTA